MTPSHPENPRAWLIRIPDVFGDWRPEILAALGARSAKRMGAYDWITLPDGVNPRAGRESLFLSWSIGLEHAWPCHPAKMEGFVEKAAVGLARTFGERGPRTVLVGLLRPGAGDTWFKRLASNVRGRCLQWFPGSGMPLADAGSLAPDQPVLYVMIGKEGLYAGMASPRDVDGFFPGGVFHLSKDAGRRISRAGSKVAEALHYSALHGPLPTPGAHWLELGASPGGMTLELLERGFRVTAVDRAPLDSRLDGVPGLVFHQRDVGDFVVEPGMRHDALLCDMNGDPVESFTELLRLSAGIGVGGWVVFTLKTTGRDTMEDIIALHQEVLERGRAASLDHLATRHFGGNRREFTMLWRKMP